MSSHQFQLAPDSSQRKNLSQIFTGPELLLNLLRLEKNPPQNRSEIGFFLLKNKSQIYPYICENMRDNVDALHDVIHNFIKSKDKGPRIDFLNDCSISGESFYFPIRGLKLIKATDEAIEILKVVRKGNRYTPGFSLIKENSNFFVEIDFELSSHQKNYEHSMKPEQLVITTNKNKKRFLVKGNQHYKNATKPTQLEITAKKSNSVIYENAQSNLSKIDKLIRFVECGVVRNHDNNSSFSYNWGGGSIWTLPGGGGPGTGKKR